MTEPGSSKKILVVDDEADMRIFVSTVCKIGGYEAITAENGFQALELARTHRPDLVILDIMMPKTEDGVKTFFRFKSDIGLSHIPLIILSAISQKTFRHYVSVSHPPSEISRYEPDGYMEKPPDAEELIRLIGSVLSR